MVVVQFGCHPEQAALCAARDLGEPRDRVPTTPVVLARWGGRCVALSATQQTRVRLASSAKLHHYPLGRMFACAQSAMLSLNSWGLYLCGQRGREIRTAQYLSCAVRKTRQLNRANDRLGAYS